MNEVYDGNSMISDVTMDTIAAKVPFKGKQNTIRKPQDPQEHRKINGVKKNNNRSTTPVVSHSNSTRQLQIITNKIPIQSSWVDRLAYQETVSSRKMKESPTQIKKETPKPTNIPQSSSKFTSSNPLSQSVHERLYRTRTVTSKQIKSPSDAQKHPSSEINGIQNNSTKRHVADFNSINHRVAHPLINKTQTTTQMPMNTSNISSPSSIYDRLYRTKTVSSTQSAIVLDKNRKMNQRSSLEHRNQVSFRAPTEKTTSTTTDSTKVSSVHERLYRTSTVSLRGTRVLM